MYTPPHRSTRNIIMKIWKVRSARDFLEVVKCIHTTACAYVYMINILYVCIFACLFCLYGLELFVVNAAMYGRHIHVQYVRTCIFLHKTVHL